MVLSINYIPVAGDQVTILRAAAVTNKFEEILGVPENWIVNYTPTSVVLTYGSAPLPVKLISFSGKKNTDNHNHLQWITADEKDFEHFDIQRSEDAKSFETIGIVSSQTNIGEPVSNPSGQALHAYSFIDNTPGTFHYYRLKMVDRDGTFKYSRILSIKNSPENSVVGNFYPNPSSGPVFIDIFSVESGQWTVSLFDAGGKRIDLKVHDLKKGMNKISVEGLSSGMNLVCFEHGLLSQVRKVVRQ